MCRSKTAVFADTNNNGNIDISVKTICSEINAIMERNRLPQDIPPAMILEKKDDVLPELIFSCSQVPGASCPFICVVYKAIESEAKLSQS
jgi:hypothetical protein